MVERWTGCNGCTTLNDHNTFTINLIWNEGIVVWSGMRVTQVCQLKSFFWNEGCIYDRRFKIVLINKIKIHIQNQFPSILSSSAIDVCSWIRLDNSVFDCSDSFSKCFLPRQWKIKWLVVPLLCFSKVLQFLQ